jgi:adenylate cyclase
MLAHTYLMDVHLGWSDSPKESFEKAVEINQKVEEIVGEESYNLQAWFCWLNREFDKAISKMEKAVTVDPNDDFYHMFLGQILVHAGRAQDGITAILKAMRLNPFYPPWYLCRLALGYVLSGRLDEAIKAYEGVLQRDNHDIGAHIGLVTSNIRIGREEKARAHAQELLKRYPGFSLSDVAKMSHTYKDKTVVDRAIEALRKAGLK